MYIITIHLSQFSHGVPQTQLILAESDTAVAVPRHGIEYAWADTSMFYKNRGKTATWWRTLTLGYDQFIADIRACRVKELEEKRINKEMANIRKQFKGPFHLALLAGPCALG